MAGITQENINELQSKLLGWYTVNGRKFPWRKGKLTTYQIIISEALLQRTKAETVSIFFEDFITLFPNWESIVSAETETIENFLHPLGLYRQRAKRLQSLAEEMLRRKGEIPTNRKELESIPFLGQYITNAVELIILKQPSPLLDVNMARVLERYFGERKMADIRYDPYLQKLSFLVVDHVKSKEINWGLLNNLPILICFIFREIKQYLDARKKRQTAKKACSEASIHKS